MLLRRRGRRRAATSPAPTGPTTTCAASSPAATSRRARRRPHRRGGRHGRRRPDPHRARDRGRQHLPARHPLLRAARRDLPRRARAASSPIVDGLLRDRARRASPPPPSSSSPTSTGSRGRGDRARGTCTWSRSASRRARARGRRGALRGARGRRARGALRRPRRRSGREVRRRRAARLPAAPDGRQARARVRRPPRSRSAAGARDERPRRAARGGRATRSQELWRERCRPSSRGCLRGCFGLDRSGPPPPADAARAAAAPVDDPERDRLRPARADPGLPRDRAVARDDGTDALRRRRSSRSIGWGDYADGIAARVTGQYSRLGALLDPVIDRAAGRSRRVVCWHFELLPRWALAVLVARELLMLVLGPLRRCAAGSSCEINWPGRIAVGPMMGAIFFALCGLDAARGGPALRRARARARGATALYVRDGACAQAAPGCRPSSSG